MSTASQEMAHFRWSLRQTAVFVYQHSLSLIGVSLCWFLASLPIITAGPATLSACSAVRSVRDRNTIDKSKIFGTLRQHGVNATFVTLVPIVIGVVTIWYFAQYVRTNGTQYMVLSVLGVYLFVFLSLLILASFIRIAGDAKFTDAISDSYLWVVHNPVLSAMTVISSSIIMLIGMVSIVGLVIIVPAVLFSFHTLVANVD